MTDTIAVTVAQTIPGYLDTEPDVVMLDTRHFNRDEAPYALGMLRKAPRVEIVYVEDSEYEWPMLGEMQGGDL